MLRFFLFMVCVMTVGTSAAGGVAPCSVGTVPIQIMTPASGGNEIKRSTAEISNSLPHFRAFVTAVTERINSRLTKDKLCITGAESTESMTSAESEQRSLLQFVHWPLNMHREYTVPVLPFTGGRQFPSCLISSPWINLVVYRKPVPQIRGIVRWSEHQLLADQAVLAGAKNMPLGVAIPLSGGEFGHFVLEYEDTEIPPRPAVKPIEERVPPDILWLLRRSMGTRGPFIGSVSLAMNKATEKGAAGYTRLVLALIDRCFAADVVSDGVKWKNFYYNNILDAADLIPLEQYRIDKLY